MPITDPCAGQISGFLEMPDFLDRFSDTTAKGQKAFSNSREGTIVGLVSCVQGFAKYWRRRR